MQRQLQENLAAEGKAPDLSTASFKVRMRDLDVQWRNMTLEFAELMERLPYKEWKDYPPRVRDGFTSVPELVEVWYEYVDMLHFFVVMGLDLGITPQILKRLYATKNAENLRRLRSSSKKTRLPRKSKVTSK